MNTSRVLEGIVRENLEINKCCASVLSTVVLCVLLCRSVNLTRLVHHVPGGAKMNSKYRRLQRFFSGADICYEKLSSFLLSLFFTGAEPVYLSIDRTNWQWGKFNINILMVAAVYKGIAIPVLWKMLDKKGNSNTAERVELLEEFIKIFGVSKIKGLLADREFVGKKWFNYLKDKNIQYVIRIKKDTKISTSRGKETQVKNIFQQLPCSEYQRMKGTRRIWEVPVYISALRLEDGELLILITDIKNIDAVEIYKKRWEIETLFGCLKSRGFNFEALRITKPERVKRVLAVLAITFVWAHKTGEWCSEHIAKLKVKTHGRLEKSIFRYGLDMLLQALIPTNNSTPKILQFLKLLSPKYAHHSSF